MAVPGRKYGRDKYGVASYDLGYVTVPPPWIPASEVPPTEIWIPIPEAPPTEIWTPVV